MTSGGTALWIGSFEVLLEAYVGLVTELPRARPPSWSGAGALPPPKY